MFSLLRQYVRDVQHELVPQCRVLTVGERALARSVFGDALGLDTVRLCSSRLILKRYAMSPNGVVYFNPNDFVTDFSLTPLNTQAWLIHELTHVWQVQQGIAVFRRALVDRRYNYVLVEGKAFLQYGVEQQAQMVQDWFLMRARGEECEAVLPF